LRAQGEERWRTDGGKAAKGLPDVQRALEFDPEFAAAYDTRGHIYEALGRKEDAIADFRKALALDPEELGSREGLKRLSAPP
jgi:Tfp pilus assembly protein PilF